MELSGFLVNSISALSLLLAFTLPSALLIFNTSKQSPLRFLWIVGLGFIAYRFCLVSSRLTTSFVLNGIATGQGMIGAFQCFNLLLITGIDDEELLQAAVYQPSASLTVKLSCTFGLLTNYRGIDTPWQAKNVPKFPSFYTNQGSPERVARGWYILRQCLIIAWQYVLLDIIYISSLDASAEENSLLFGPGTEFRYWNVTPELWIGRFFAAVFSWFVPARVVLDITSRVFLLPLVAIGILHPKTCPPTFGSMADAYTIRRFWR